MDEWDMLYKVLSVLWEHRKALYKTQSIYHLTGHLHYVYGAVYS